jgi:putative glutamine amidotransferase
MKPVIGIPAHPTLQERNHTIIQSCGENYLRSIEKAGGIPLILPICEEPEAIEKYVSMCDGFLIPGGIDVNPLSYGEGPHPLLQMTRLEYDSYEIKLIQEIYKNRKPMLGICRGIQIINVAFGGTLWQDVSLRPDPTLRHQQMEMDSCCVSHKVLIEKDSILYSLFGSELLTNSYHHQAVREPGRGLKITALAQDGVVEGIEAAEDYPFLLALQWHPECFTVLENNPMAPIFTKLIEACS